MKKIIYLLSTCFILSIANAQGANEIKVIKDSIPQKLTGTTKEKPKPAPAEISDTVAIISVAHMRELINYYKSTLTVNEFDKVFPALQQLVAIGAEAYRKNKKPK